MNKYIVAYVNHFEGGLVQELVESTSERAAMLKYLALRQDINFLEDELLNMESADQVAETCYDMDAHISAYKLD